MMTYTKLLKWMVSAYVAFAVLAFFFNAVTGSYQDGQLKARIWGFPLSFELALVVLFSSILAAYSLIFRSWHGRILLSLIAVVYFFNMVLTSTLVHSTFAAALSATSLIFFGILLYLAWSNPLPKRIKHLAKLKRREQLIEQRKQELEEQATVHYPLPEVEQTAEKTD